jgi:type IV pilus biogenesis protein PilP
VTRRERALIAAAALAAAVLFTARGRRPVVEAPARPASEPRPQAASEVPLAPVDPSEIRDVFRYAERAPMPMPRGAPRPAPAASTPSPASDLPRLVGLVRREGRLLAAFSLGGGVVLAGAGDTADGLTVLDVTDEGVRIRRKDGSEEQLRVP